MLDVLDQHRMGAMHVFPLFIDISVTDLSFPHGAAHHQIN